MDLIVSESPVLLQNFCKHIHIPTRHDSRYFTDFIISLHVKHGWYNSDILKYDRNGIHNELDNEYYYLSKYGYGSYKLSCNFTTF